MFRCAKCGQPWDDNRARDNELHCTRRCGGQLVFVKPLALPDLEGIDLNRLPYPLALTGRRLAGALQASGDVLKTLFLLKDCFEATIKYFGAVLLAEFRHSSACTPEYTEVLLKSMVRPSLGTWVSDVIRPLSLWLLGDHKPPGKVVAALFAEPPAKPGGKPAEAVLMQRCKQFVTYRNDALGHGAQRRDSVYEKDLAEWLPLLRQLLDDVARLASWRLCLVTADDRCQVWLGPQPDTTTEPGSFSKKEIGHFVLRGPSGASRDLSPFLCYLPDSQQENRLHYYDSLYRYQATKKEVTVLEYDNGERHPRPEPAAGLEEAFTAELLVKAFKWHRGRMEVIEGRIANFGELIEAHAAIVGRRFVIDYVRRFLHEHDRGLVLIQAQPGMGKTALLAHLIEEVFGHYAPRPVHFFYRRTAGITDPDVCVRSLYAALLEAHGITEAEESKQKNSPEEVFIKLTNLLNQEIAPRLLPGRPQLLFIDALDEANGNAFTRIPENLPAGVYVIATTRPVTERASLARRPYLYWYDLAQGGFVEANRRDGFEYVQRELVGAVLPDQTLDEIARLGAGNFLVLKLLCQHVRTALPPDQVGAFLRRLAADSGKDQLGFIYEEFWNRLTDRCTRADVILLCDVAGTLVMACAPLTADIICGALGLGAGDWDFAFRHLTEYLTVVEDEEETVKATFYRIYHESFADFLRAKVATDRDRLRNRLADYCLNWPRLPEGYGRWYALRFGPTHLLESGRLHALAQLLCSEDFVLSRKDDTWASEDALVKDYRDALVNLSRSDRLLIWEAPSLCLLLGLRGIGQLIDVGEFNKAQELLLEAEESVSAGGRPEAASFWNCLSGGLAIYRGSYDEAERKLSLSLDLARKSGFAVGVAKALLTIGVLFRKKEDSSLEAQDCLQQALAADFSAYDPGFRARVLLNLAMLHIRKGCVEEAEGCLEKASNAVEESRSPVLGAWLLKYRGFLDLLRGECSAANATFCHASREFRRLGDDEEVKRCDMLAICSTGPEFYRSATQEIHSSISQNRSREAALVISKKIESVREELLRPEIGLLNETKQEERAQAIVDLRKAIARLEREFDPHPRPVANAPVVRLPTLSDLGTTSFQPIRKQFLQDLHRTVPKDLLMSWDFPPQPQTTPTPSAAGNKPSHPLTPAAGIVTNSFGMKFTGMPPGTFLMGSPPSEPERNKDEVQHRVTLTRGYYLSVALVTQAQWRQVMNWNSSHFQGDHLPVDSISWEDCQEFCRKLREKEGRPYRLPTEAEWEYACRAGTTTPFSFGDIISTDQANYDGNYIYDRGKRGRNRSETTPGGTFPANAWGLFDMHGNLWEWCLDWYGPYPAEDVVDPQGPLSGSARVLRGGAWDIFPRHCRSAYRSRIADGFRYHFRGCRVGFCLE